MKDDSLTPAMQQYARFKREHPDAVLLFRMGDFYEMFYEDALVASRALELTLTSRSKDADGGSIPMCGVPYHAVDGYLAKMVKKGFRVAICEQVEDPAEAKKRGAKSVVERAVVRVITPGTLTDTGLLAEKADSPLLALAPRKTGRDWEYGLAWLVLSSGELRATTCTAAAGRRGWPPSFTAAPP